jgi:hypothetical protein
MKIESLDVFTIGKSRVAISVTGCVDCGAAESNGCENAVLHMATVGNRKRRIMLKRCAPCATKLGAAWPSEISTARVY